MYNQIKQPQRTCMETLIQQEMRKLCKKFNVEFTEKYYTENHDMYTTFILGRLQQKLLADKIIKTLQN